jgi:hypothetical protein
MVGPSGPNILFAMPPLALMFILDSLARLRRTMHGGLVAVECLPDIGLDRFALVIPSPPCSTGVTSVVIAPSLPDALRPSTHAPKEPAPRCRPLARTPRAICYFSCRSFAEPNRARERLVVWSTLSRRLGVCQIRCEREPRWVLHLVSLSFEE